MPAPIITEGEKPQMTEKAVFFTSDSPLTVGEVAALFRVCPDTVARWDKAGRLPSDFHTPGGQRRWRPGTNSAALKQGVPGRRQS